ncbi:MAG: argininosuccinate synthase [Desulfobulbaceae bacterium]
MTINKIVLAYSGGLDTSVILKWLQENYQCPVVAFAADLGQDEDWNAVREKGMATGAVKVVIADLKETFVKDFIFPAFRANAIYEGSYLLGTSLARPLIAREQVRVAAAEGADAVSHGATGKGNDQVRFELTYMALNPHLKIIAPWRLWDLNSRTRLISYAQEHNIPVPVTREKPYSSDENLLHISFEGGILEDPWNEPDPFMFKMTRAPEDAPDTPSYVELDFVQGNPVAINSRSLSPGDLFQMLNRLGGENGIGRLDMVENRFVGMKSRGVYETPGGTILRTAHRDLETITMDREVMRIRDSLVARYSELVYNGFWFSPEMQLLQKTMDEAQATVSGTVRLKLYKGNCMPVGRKSDQSLYQESFATFEEDEVYNQADAAGFIKLAKTGLLSGAELEQILGGLMEIESEIASNTFVFRSELEDIHMNIEKTLVEKVGQAGEKLHTARSRNDQVALDMRLYLRDESQHLIALLADLQKGFVALAREYMGVMMPGYTHLQRAQPVLLSHHLLAYYEMFSRDKARLNDCLKRINVLPLGSGALAGTSLPIDRDFVARELGFTAVSANSMDAVSDRDFMVEFLAACGLIQIHLSRFSEELVLWASQEFNFVEIADRFCTGSSIMPQKKNPDMPELIRGKSGRVVGNLMALLTVLKGLPMSYNRDLQEDKEPVFDSVDTVSQSLAVMVELLSGLSFNREILLHATQEGFITATDLAEYLVRKNIPFRQAHAIVGQAVAYCIANGKELTDLTLEELQVFSAAIAEEVFEVLSVEGSVNSRTASGGTAGTAVMLALEKAETDLGI